MAILDMDLAIIEKVVVENNIGPSDHKSVHFIRQKA